MYTWVLSQTSNVVAAAAQCTVHLVCLRLVCPVCLCLCPVCLCQCIEKVPVLTQAMAHDLVEHT